MELLDVEVMTNLGLHRKIITTQIIKCKKSTLKKDLRHKFVCPMSSCKNHNLCLKG